MQGHIIPSENETKGRVERERTKKNGCIFPPQYDLGWPNPRSIPSTWFSHNKKPAHPLEFHQFNVVSLSILTTLTLSETSAQQLSIIFCFYSAIHLRLISSCFIRHYMYLVWPVIRSHWVFIVGSNNVSHYHVNVLKYSIELFELHNLFHA